MRRDERVYTGNCQVMHVLSRHPRVAMRAFEDRPIRVYVGALSSASCRPASLPWCGTRAGAALVY